MYDTAKEHAPQYYAPLSERKKKQDFGTAGLFCCCKFYSETMKCSSSFFL